LRKAGNPLAIIPIPPILAARIFPPPGQQGKLISLPTWIFSKLQGEEGGFYSFSNGYTVIG